MSSFKTFQRKTGHMMGNAMHKGSDLVETGKIRLNIGREERAVDELLYKIGEAVYENCKKNGVTPEYITANCDEVEERRSRIVELKNKLSAQKDASPAEDETKEEIIIDINIDDAPKSADKE